MEKIEYKLYEWNWIGRSWFLADVFADREKAIETMKNRKKKSDEETYHRSAYGGQLIKIVQTIDHEEGNLHDFPHKGEIKFVRI